MLPRLPLITVTSFAALLLSTPPAAAAPRTHLVVIDKMKFGAVPAGIRTGDRIVWVNRDMFRHTATARNGHFDLDLPPGGRRIAVIEKASTLHVICRYHPGMRTTLRIAK